MSLKFRNFKKRSLNWIYAALLFLGSWALILCGSCGKEDLEPLQTNVELSLADSWSASLKGEFCTTEPVKIKTNVKMIFIVDKSKSNFDNRGKVGTDIDGSRRYGGLSLYVKQKLTEENLSLALINLSTDASIVQDFTNDKQAFLEMLNKEKIAGGGTPPVPQDEGWTNFGAALVRAKEIIDADLKKTINSPDPVSTVYTVFFISDGAPWVSDTTLQTTAEVLAAEAAIIKIGEDNKEYVESINVHTAYYSLNPDARDADAASYLRQMATAGKGDFYEFGAGNTIDFNRFSVPQSFVRNVLREAYVENVSTVWEGAEYLQDSDGDGLSDKLEKTLGSDPLKADSDGNGISDAVEYFSTGKPCKDLTCKPELAEPYKACAGWFDPSAPAGTKKYSDLDHDLLNDCEEQVILHSRRDRFDSNFDWIPDWLAFKNRIAFVPGSDDSNSDPDFDTVSNQQEIKMNSPSRGANDKIPDLKKTNLQVQIFSEDASKTCYTLTANQIQVLGDTANLRLFLLEGNSVVSEKRYMRLSTKGVTRDSPVAVFRPEDFK